MRGMFKHVASNKSSLTKFFWHKKRSSISTMITVRQSRNVLRILIAGLAIFIMWELRTLLSAILGALVIFTLFRNFFDSLVEERKLNRKFSAFIVIIFSLIIIVIPF